MRISSKERLKNYDEYMLIKNFAKATRRSYLLCLNQFLSWREEQEIYGELNQEQARGFVDIPQSVIELLRSYYIRYKPVKYLFHGKTRGKQMSPSAVQMAIRMARKNARILKQVSTHTFRHCYATHHLESGTNIVYLQKQMGHVHLKTTAKYIRLSETYIYTISHPINNIAISYHPQHRR